jgi:hypothetical protein
MSDPGTEAKLLWGAKVPRCPKHPHAGGKPSAARYGWWCIECYDEDPATPPSAREPRDLTPLDDAETNEAMLEAETTRICQAWTRTRMWSQAWKAAARAWFVRGQATTAMLRVKALREERAAALSRAEAAERRIRETEQACHMPLDMIATTLDAHRVTAQADHERAEAAERQADRLASELETAERSLSSLRAGAERLARARFWAEAWRAAPLMRRGRARGIRLSDRTVRAAGRLNAALRALLGAGDATTTNGSEGAKGDDRE